MKKTARKILSLILVAAMVFSIASTAMAGYVAPKFDDGYYYVALGDSVAAGFGMTERENYSTMDGFNAWDSYTPRTTVPESYPAVFAAQLLAELRDEEIIDELSDFNWANLGVASFQTYDYYRSILDGAWTGTFWANLTGGYTDDAVAQRESAAAQAQSYRDNPDQLWNRRNRQNITNYVVNYYDSYNGSTGKELLYTNFGIEFEYGKEPWFEAVKSLSGTARQNALRTWVNNYGQVELLPLMVDNAAKNAVNGNGWYAYYLYHDLFVEQIKKANMITLHIGANDLLEQFMFDLISVALVGSEDNPTAESFGTDMNMDYLRYGIEIDNDPESETYGQEICTLYNPAMFMMWVTLFTLMSGVDEAAVAAQLVTMISNYQSFVTEDHLNEMIAFVESSALEARLYENAVGAMRYYEPIVEMIKTGGDFMLDPYGKTDDLGDDPYWTADEYVEEFGQYTNDVAMAALDEEGQILKNLSGWVELPALNPDAQIVFVGTFNPFGTNLEYNGESYDLGNIVCNILTDIYCGLKGGDLKGMSILTGVGEVAGLIGADENDTIETAIAKLAEALAANAKEGYCKPCFIKDDTWISIFGEISKDAGNVFETVYAEPVEVESPTIIVNAATYELDGTATPGGATVKKNEDGSLTIIPDGAKFPLLGMALVNGEVVKLNAIPVGYKLGEDGIPTGETITYDAFLNQYGEQPDQWSWWGNSKGINYDTWMGYYNSYAWTNIYSYMPGEEESTEITLIMRSAISNEAFAEFVNTDAGKHSLLDLVATLMAGAEEGAAFSFMDLASEDAMMLFKGLYGAVDLELPDPYDFENIGAQSYLGIGDLEDLLSMDLIFAVLLMQTGMDADAALETAQLLTVVYDNVHFPVMQKLMGEPGLKACDYLNEIISGVAADWDSRFVYILDMPNENDFNPHPTIENAAWLANRIFESIIFHVTVEGAGGDGHGMVYGPNSKRGNNAYDVLYGFNATFDAVPDYAYKLGSYSVNGVEVTDFDSNHIVIEGIKEDKTLSVVFAEGEDPFSIGAPRMFSEEYLEGLLAVSTTAPDAKDGLILNTTTDMEWTDNLENPDWAACGNGATSGLGAGTYYVRYLHGGRNYVAVQIGEGKGGENVAPTQVFGIATSVEGASDGALSRTTPQMEYTTEVDEEGNPVWTNAIPCGDGSTGNLPAGTYYVRYSDGEAYVTVTILGGTGKADIAPNVTGKNTSDKGAKDGKLLNTTNQMQYSTNENFWNPSTCNNGTTDNLRAGTYYVRYIGGKNYTVVVIADGETPTPPPAVVYVEKEVIKEVEVKPCPKDVTCPIDQYTDTVNDFWWHDGIHYCLENGYMNGIGGDLFDPAGSTNRAMVVTILWRLEGCPIVDTEMTFEDASGAWYTDAIRWAQSTGVVKGFSATEFKPLDRVTREQMATFIWRYANYKGYALDQTSDLAAFDDVADVSDWALSAVKWANGAGIIQGRSYTTIIPRDDASRAEIATIIMRFCENIVKK